MATPSLACRTGPLCRGGEPGGGVVRDIGTDPGLQSGGVRLLHALLGKIQIPRDTHRRGEHPGPVAAVRADDRLLDGRDVCHPVVCSSRLTKPLWTGRTSTPPPSWTTGLRRAIARAASRSGASIT